MRILIVSPLPLDIPGGNTSSILRLQDGLVTLGHQVETCAADALQGREFSKGELDVVHGFHLRKGGLPALHVANETGARLIATLTGTETSLDWHNEDRRADLLRVLNAGARMIALRSSHLDEMRALSGLPLTDAVVIPQTIRVGQDPYDLRGKLGLAADVKLVLLPGGLRPVKGQDWAVDALENFAGSKSSWHLVLMGPVLDADYGDLLLPRVESNERAHYVGPVSQEYMGACYAACDLVLNTSETEGESNAILEAMQAGRVVLARSNEGNRALIEHGVNGMLFERPDELQQGLAQLLANDESRGRLAARARADVEPRLDLDLEIQAHLRAYADR